MLVRVQGPKQFRNISQDQKLSTSQEKTAPNLEFEKVGLLLVNHPIRCTAELPDNAEELPDKTAVLPDNVASLICSTSEERGRVMRFRRVQFLLFQSSNEP